MAEKNGIMVFEGYSLDLLSDSSTVDEHDHHHKLYDNNMHANIINKQPIILRAYIHNIIPVLYSGK